MTKRIVIDWGFNVVPFDPQILRRDFWGACVVFAFGLFGGFAASWVGLALIQPAEMGAIDFLKALSAQELPLFSWLALRGLGCLSMGVILGFLGFVEQFKPRSRLINQAGRKYTAGKEAVQKIQEFFKVECAEQGEGIQLSQDFKISRRRETTHGLILGAVGAGKTTIAHHILKSIFTRKDKAIIVDWKGDFTASYPALILNPLDSRSKRWAVSLDVQTELDATAFASQMVPDTKGSNGDDFFTNAARAVFTGLVIKLQKTKSKKWTWADLYDEVSAPFESIHDAIATHYKHALNNIAEEGKTSQSVLATMIASCGEVLRKLAQAELDNPTVGAISIDAWLSKDLKTNQIVLGGSPENKNISRAFMSSFITMTSNKVLSLPDSHTRRVWFVLDEFPLLGKVEAISTTISVGRSKGACVWLLAQDISQIRETYGQNIAKALPSMLGTIIIGQTQGGETAETIAKQWIGTQIVERRNITTQGNGASSSSFQRDEMLVVHPSELQTELGIKNNRAHALLVGCGDYVYNLPWSFVAPQKFRDGYVLRDCFAADKTTTPDKTQEELLGQQVTTKKELEHEDKVGEKITEHFLHGAIEPTGLGVVLEAISALEMLNIKTNIPTAQATHTHRLNKHELDNEEQERE